MTAAFDLAMAEAWAMAEKPLLTLFDIAARTNETPAAIETQLGRPLVNSQKTTIRDGVAMVPIAGPIFRRANLFTQISGATSNEVLARDLRAAADDPAVTAILLAIDSPGGEVNGTNEVAKLVATIRDEGNKPIVAYVSGMAASGAYWIASAASKIYVDETALLGSIGVIAGFTDRSEMPGQPKKITIISSQSPNKAPDPTTDAGRATIRATVDGLAEVFIAQVAAGRDVSVETVKEDFGQGDVLIGAAAVAAGMADGIATHEEVLAGLIAGTIADADPRPASPQHRGTGKMVTKNADQIRAEHPEAFAEISATARKEGEIAGDALGRQAGHDEGLAVGIAAGKAEGLALGADAERLRVVALEAVALPGYEPLLAAHKADAALTDTDLMRAQVDAQKAKGGQAIAATAADEQTLAIDLPQPAASASGTPAVQAVIVEGDEEGAVAADKAEWSANSALRAEFNLSGEAGYLAYAKAARAGTIKAPAVMMVPA